MNREILMGVRLENGLGIRLLRRSHLRTVNMGLFVRHGSRHEEKESNGIAHYLEHILWNPRHMPRRAQMLLYRLVDSGARYEAYTSKEYTRFMVTCLPAEVDLALEIMGVIMQEQEVRADAVEHERCVILHEHTMSFTSTRIIFSEVLDNSIWGDRSLGLFVIGRRENIERFDQNDLGERLRRFYTPERSCLVMIGPVDGERFLESSGRYLVAWRGNDVSIDEPVTEADPRHLAIPQNSTRVDLLLGFPGPGLGTRERWTMEILGDILGAGWRSRLFLALREGRKLAYLVRSYAKLYYGGGYIGIQVNCELRDVEEVFSVLREEIERLRWSGVGEEEVERAKAGKRMVLFETVDDSAGYLHLLGRRALQGEDFDPQRELEGFLRVSPEEVTRVAREVLDFDGVAVVARGLEAPALERLCSPLDHALVQTTTEGWWDDGSDRG